MNTWLTTQIGAEAANIVSYVALFIAAILVLWLVIVIVKRLNKGTYVVGGKNRQPRLSVRDAAPIDSKRQLVLIKRDNVEHLILIGGPTDLVIERNISDLPPQMVNTTDMLTISDIAGEQSDNSQEISSIFPTSNAATASQLSTATPSPVRAKKNLAPKLTPESHLDAHDFVPQNGSTKVEAPHTDLTPSKAKINDNDQTIFANLAIHKNNTKKVVNTPLSDSTKAMNDSNYQGVEFEKVEIPASEVKPFVEDVKNITDNGETPDDGSQYITYSQDRDLENQTSNNAAVESRQKFVVHDDKISNSDLNNTENESLDDSTELEVQPLDQFSQQDDLSIEENSSSITYTNAEENTASPIPMSGAKTQQDIGNKPSFAKAEADIRTDKSRDYQYDSGGRAAVSLQPKPSQSGHSGQPNVSASIKTSPSANISAPEQDDNEDRSSEDLVRQEQTPKQQPSQANQTNPFGKPKPINPYKVMKASGAFRQANNNVNFGPSLANTPLNKDNTVASKNEPAKTSIENAIRQETTPSLKATPSKVDMPDNTVKADSLTGVKTPAHKPIATSADENSSSSSSVLTKDSGMVAATVNKEQVASSSNIQSDLNETKPNNLNKSNPSGKAISQNIGNTSISDEGRLKATSSTDSKSQVSQERPIAQRSVPQGMLRPPLMAKPRNATTSSPNVTPVRGASTAKVEQNTAPIAADIDSTNMGLKNDVIGLQSVRTVREDVTDTVTITNTSEVNDNTQFAETETTNKTLNTSPQAVKPAPQNKISNLQKFSLQLLEPQHILDKPSRNDENGEDAKAPIGKSAKSRDEDEFDRRLQSELDQSNKK